MKLNHRIPPVLAGPILRRISTTEMAFWFVTIKAVDIRIELYPDREQNQVYELAASSDEVTCLTFSPLLQYQMVDLSLITPLPYDRVIKYKLLLRFHDDLKEGWQDIISLLPDLLYPQQDMLQFCVPKRVRSLLHGSCRKPHHSGIDGLVEADKYIGNLIEKASDENKWPSMLVMSGDQIYADDVAGPMLHASHQLSRLLSFPQEEWKVDPNSSSTMTNEALYQHSDCYYRRDHLLPQGEEHRNLIKVLFGGARKPIFTSSTADNHFITLGEYLAGYLLAWSPVPWRLVNLDMPGELKPERHALYLEERQYLEQFIEGLPQVQRVMAHIPVAMMFDDHDITDDFNLHRHWEETVYNHPLSKRMVGNGMLAYLINQAWGNNPQAFNCELLSDVQHALNHPNQPHYDVLVDKLIKLEAWDYDWNTTPPLIVLDTRTRRWRSESSPYKPSGLLDWEALTELQGRLSGHPSVLMVSAAPIFGVKLIEVLQRIVTFFGHPLAVDAEYWMAHPGTAHGILNIFCHRKTPQNFVVLSGDVHYSFVYDIELKGLNNSPDIWQICSSGLKNTFPEPLLGTFDKLNRWLYSPRSPLNWFTKRRKMRITPRKPIGAPSGRRLLNHSGIGLIELDDAGRPIKISQLIGKDKPVLFEGREEEASWH